MTTLVSKWGNSLGIRISKSIAAAANVGDGDEVNVSVQNGAFVIRPAVKRYTIEELVEGITPKNRHVDVDWGRPTGKATGLVGGSLAGFLGELQETRREGRPAQRIPGDQQHGVVPGNGAQDRGHHGVGRHRRCDPSAHG